MAHRPAAADVNIRYSSNLACDATSHHHVIEFFMEENLLSSPQSRAMAGSKSPRSTARQFRHVTLTSKSSKKPGLLPPLFLEDFRTCNEENRPLLRIPSGSGPYTSTLEAYARPAVVSGQAYKLLLGVVNPELSKKDRRFKVYVQFCTPLGLGDF